MELCNGGDLEAFIRNQPGNSLPVQSCVIPFLFQMVFALYAGKADYSLRHYDIKVRTCLNPGIASSSTNSNIIH